VEICADIAAKEPWTRSSICPHYHLLSFLELFRNLETSFNAARIGRLR